MAKDDTKKMQERRRAPNNTADAARREMDRPLRAVEDAMGRRRGTEDPLSVANRLVEDYRHIYMLAVRLDALLREGYALGYRQIEWVASDAADIDCAWMQRVRDELGHDPLLYCRGTCCTEQ